MKANLPGGSSRSGPLMSANPTHASLHAGLSIRPARPADLDALVALEERCFPADRMSRESYRRALRSPRALVLKAVDGSTVVGCGVLLFRADTPVARLYSIAVAPEMRGYGLGQQMMRRLEREARQRGASALRLEVSVHNTTALALYAKIGYEVVRSIPKYYGDGSSALQLRKPLRRAATAVRGLKQAR